MVNIEGTYNSPVTVGGGVSLHVGTLDGSLRGPFSAHGDGIGPVGLAGLNNAGVSCVLRCCNALSSVLLGDGKIGR